MFGSETWSLTSNCGNGIVITLRDLDPLQEYSLTVSLTVSLSLTYKEMSLINPVVPRSAHLAVPPRVPLLCCEGARVPPRVPL